MKSQKVFPFYFHNVYLLSIKVKDTLPNIKRSDILISNSVCKFLKNTILPYFGHFVQNFLKTVSKL